MAKKITKRQRRAFSSMEKCKAILSLWTERRSASEVCRELRISSSQLNRWQDLAMEAMLASLEPRCGKQENLPPLNQRLEKLLAKKSPAPPQISPSKLEQRLEKIQKTST